MTADSLLGKAVYVSCTVSVVKADCVQGGATTNLNRVRREISISVAALNSPL